MLFATPKSARIPDNKYPRFAHVLKTMSGLEKQEFRVIGTKNGLPLVHPDDHPSRAGELTLNPDLVEYLDES